jgi:FkbM family methyltransferase
MTVKRSLRGRLLRAVAQGEGPVSRLLLRLAERYVAVARNNELDGALNGEFWMLRRLTRLEPRVVFDVGANRGEWAQQAATALPSARIHAFETVPVTARHLAAVASTQPAIHPNAFGLADAPGRVRLHVTDANDKVSSLLPVPEISISFFKGMSWRVIEVDVMRGDEYAALHGITTIDVLKIDVEGAEHRVMAGFGNLITDGHVGLIQFEYGLANIQTHMLLSDYYRQLESYGYKIGKLMPSRVAFKKYDMRDEDFIGPNYVAVHASRPDMLVALS